MIEFFLSLLTAYGEAVVSFSSTLATSTAPGIAGLGQIMPLILIGLPVAFILWLLLFWPMLILGGKGGGKKGGRGGRGGGGPRIPIFGPIFDPTSASVKSGGGKGKDGSDQGTGNNNGGDPDNGNRTTVGGPTIPGGGPQFGGGGNGNGGPGGGGGAGGMKGCAAQMATACFIFLAVSGYGIHQLIQLIV